LKEITNSPIWHCLLAVLIPVVYIFAYMTIGKKYPQWDPAEYMQTGLGIYNIFVDQGFVEGLKALYLQRGWRPTLTPVVIIPFYALTGGKALAAMQIACPVLYGVFLLYVALLLRPVLQGMRLVFALLLTGTQITLVTIGLDFWSELPYCVASAATLYHFYKCNHFQDRRHCAAAGIALGLVFCFRPIVGFGTFAVPLFLYLYFSVRKGMLRWRDVGAWFLYAAAGLTIAGALYMLPGNKSWLGFGLLGFMIAATIALAFAGMKHFEFNANNLLVASVVYALPVWWFGLFVREVLAWTFANTFGDLIRVHLELFPQPRDSLVAFLKVIAKITVTVPSLGVLSVAAAAVIMRTITQGKLPKPGTTSMLIGAICVVPFLGTLTTYNGDPRYLVVSAFVLVMSCAAWFLMGANSRTSTIRRVAILSPALVLQVAFLASRMSPFPDHMQRLLDRYLLSTMFPQTLPVLMAQRHPAEPVYEQIRGLVGESSGSRIGVIIPNAFSYLNLPDVNLIATENKQMIFLSLASQWVPLQHGMSDELRVRDLSEKFTHLLIGPMNVWESVPDPIGSVGKFLIDPRSCLEKAKVLVPGADSDDVREFVLVRIDSPGDVRDVSDRPDAPCPSSPQGR